MHFAEPGANLAHLNLARGLSVADLGAGTGHYALAAAQLVGEHGRVYAVDIQEDVLTHLQNAARSGGLYNVETVWGDLERPQGSGLRDGSVDAAIISNILFQLPNKPALLREARRILKVGSPALVVDWSGSHGGMGPASHLVYPEQEAEALFLNGGFRKAASFRAGPYHYGFVFALQES